MSATIALPSTTGRPHTAATRKHDVSRILAPTFYAPTPTAFSCPDSIKAPTTLHRSPSTGTVASSSASASSGASISAPSSSWVAEAATPRSSASFATRTSSRKGKGRAAVDGGEDARQLRRVASSPERGQDIELAAIQRSDALEPRDAGKRLHWHSGVRAEVENGDLLLEKWGKRDRDAVSQLRVMDDSFGSALPTTTNGESTVQSGVSRTTAGSRGHLLPTDAETRARLALLGYTQEVNRDWDFWASVSLTTLNLGTTQGSFWGIVTAMSYGGPVVLTWGLPISIVFMTILAAVLAEFASAFPVAGAMFTWTFKLARANPKLRDWARFMSWIIGTLLLGAHVLVEVVIAWQTTETLQGTIAASGQDWVFQSWQQYLMVVAILVLCGGIASLPATRSPKLWKGLGLVGVALYLTIFVSLLATSEGRRPINKVFTEYTNGTGFESKGYVFLLGWVYTSIVVGVESSAHLAEETIMPAKTVPRAMFASTIIGNLMGYALNVVILSTLPMMTIEDLAGKSSSVVAGSHAQPVWMPARLVFKHCPRGVAFLILTSLVMLMMLSALAQLYAASRFVWALARDSAIPFAHIMKQVSGKARVPRMATLMMTLASSVVAVLLNLTMNSGGTIFVNAIFTSALYFIMLAYVLPIIVYLSCPKDVLQFDGRNVWNLEWASRPLSWVMVFFLALVLILTACPNGSPVTTKTWSWSPLVLVVALLGSCVSWVIYGSTHYAGPIKSITIWTTGQAVDLPKQRTLTVRESTKVTSSAAKGRTAAVYEGSLPSQQIVGDSRVISGGEEELQTEWTESGWTEGTETGIASQVNDRSDSEGEHERQVGYESRRNGGHHPEIKMINTSK